MVYKINSVIIYRSSFINDHFKSKKELGGLKILTIGKNIYNTSKSYQKSKNKSLYCLFQYLFIFESPKLLFWLKIVVCEAASQNHIQGNFINNYWCFELKKTKNPCSKLYVLDFTHSWPCNGLYGLWITKNSLIK